jgi:hypothetical protein
VVWCRRRLLGSGGVAGSVVAPWVIATFEGSGQMLLARRRCSAPARVRGDIVDVVHRSSARLRVCISARLRVCASARLRICASAHLRVCATVRLRRSVASGVVAKKALRIWGDGWVRGGSLGDGGI